VVEVDGAEDEDAGVGDDTPDAEENSVGKG
jgi:hypothetical protein